MHNSATLEVRGPWCANGATQEAAGDSGAGASYWNAVDDLGVDVAISDPGKRVLGNGSR